MFDVIFVLSLCFRLGELLTFGVHVYPLEISLTSQLLQVFFMFRAINALLCQNAITISPIACTLLRLASLLALPLAPLRLLLATSRLRLRAPRSLLALPRPPVANCDLL